MNMTFYRKLPIPKEIKEEMPLSASATAARERSISEMKQILSGKSQKILLVIGPCSADREDAVMEYLLRLATLQEKVKDQILIVPRLYTNKPRTTGEGYKGMLHQPDPNAAPDLLRGLLATRKLHLRALSETGMGCADEMLYPENHRYLSDVLAYVSVGVRSVEDQQHRLTASGLEIPVGMKNPTGGDLSVLVNSVHAAQSSHTFLYRGWEVESHGNPYAHGILRGYINKDGKMCPNYQKENLLLLYEMWETAKLFNPSILVDTNHANSGKDPFLQIQIAKEVIAARRENCTVKHFVKGLMIESYLKDGAQGISKREIYGRSITDPCLGWSKTEQLILELAE